MLLYAICFVLLPPLFLIIFAMLCHAFTMAGYCHYTAAIAARCREFMLMMMLLSARGCYRRRADILRHFRRRYFSSAERLLIFHYITYCFSPLTFSLRHF